MSSKRKPEVDPHGISCNCDRCIGLRRYPQPSLCDWCGTIHAGDAANCPDTGTDEDVQTIQNLPEDTDRDVRIFWYVHNAVKSITEGVKEQMDLKSHRSKKTGGKFKQRPFLKAEHIPAKGCSARVIELREAPKQMEFSDFLLDLLIGKKEFTWGLRSESVALDMLIDTLGAKSEKWAGKTIKLVHGGPKGQYINLA